MKRGLPSASRAILAARAASRLGSSASASWRASSGGRRATPTSRAALAEWLLAHPADPRAAEVREWLGRRLREYVRDYRGVLGFTYLVLGR